MSAPQQSDGDPARDTGAPRAVITDGLPSQLPDIDPDETQEWLDSLDAVVGQRLRPLPDTWTREHLLAVTELVDAGKVTPVVGRTYPLADTAAGLRHLEEGHARGKVVITVT